MSLVILTFHGVGPLSRNIADGERNCWLDLGFFEAVLDMVRDHPHVRLTVDDGNLSDFEIILPALVRRGLQATFFICSGRLDQPSFLSRAHVRDLRAHGMSIGSHGAAHLPWRRLPPRRLSDELEGSRQTLEKVCGIPVDTAACPFGAYDRAALRALRRAGYRLVYTSDGGRSAEHQWLQSRTTVTRLLKLGDVQRLVRQGPGAWEQSLISVRKCIKRLR